MDATNVHISPDINYLDLCQLVFEKSLVFAKNIKTQSVSENNKDFIRREEII